MHSCSALATWAWIYLEISAMVPTEVGENKSWKYQKSRYDSKS